MECQIKEITAEVLKKCFTTMTILSTPILEFAISPEARKGNGLVQCYFPWTAQHYYQ